MELSVHAQQRIQQRGMRKTDVELIMRFGTRVNDGYFLRTRDVLQAQHDLKIVMSRLDRLSGRVVITAGSTVVTTYVVSRDKQRKLLSRTSRTKQRKRGQSLATT